MGLRRLDPETRMKQERAITLQTIGFSYQQIAEELGYADKSGAWRAVKAGCDRAQIDSVEHMRLIQSNRLDMLLRRAMSALSEGDLNQIVNVLRIEKRRSDLFGLDSPKQLEVAGADGGPLQTDVGEMLRLRLEEIREKSPEPLEIETETSG